MTVSIGAVLEREHRIIDDGIAIFAGADMSAVSPAQRTALLDAIAVLRRHIYLEEEYVFPPLRAAGLVGPLMVMVHEHGQMWPVLDELERLVTDGESESTAQLCRDLLEQLGSHNMKEERIVYPSADGMLPPGDLEELSKLLRTGELPAGWVCGGVPVD